MQIFLNTDCFEVAKHSQVLNQLFTFLKKEKDLKRCLYLSKLEYVNLSGKFDGNQKQKFIADYNTISPSQWDNAPIAKDDDSYYRIKLFEMDIEQIDGSFKEIAARRFEYPEEYFFWFTFDDCLDCEDEKANILRKTLSNQMSFIQIDCVQSVEKLRELAFLYHSLKSRVTDKTIFKTFIEQLQQSNLINFSNEFLGYDWSKVALTFDAKAKKHTLFPFRKISDLLVKTYLENRQDDKSTNTSKTRQHLQPNEKKELAEIVAFLNGWQEDNELSKVSHNRRKVYVPAYSQSGEVKYLALDTENGSFEVHNNFAKEAKGHLGSISFDNQDYKEGKKHILFP